MNEAPLTNYDTPNAIDVYFVDQILADICNCEIFPPDVCAGAGGISNSSASDLRGVLIRHCGNRLINPCDCTGGDCGPCPEDCGIETPAVFIHEMGHYFDLLHPQETAYGTECPNIDPANCATCGDFLCGTAAEPPTADYTVENCVATLNYPLAVPPGCNAPYQPPDVTNYMSTKGDAALCRNHFNRGQLARARATLLNLLADELL